MKLVKEGGFKYDQLEEIGENVFMVFQGFDVVVEKVMKMWYLEVNYIWEVECCN